MRPRRSGLTVAVLGADGAGKSTMSRALTDALDVPAAYLYMGVNLEVSSVVLPTTRLLLKLKHLEGGRPDMAAGPHDHERPVAQPGAILRRSLKAVRLHVRMLNLMAEEWFRQLLIWRHRRSGQLVVLDRHFFFDYYNHDIAPSGRLPLIRKVHGWLLDRLYPRPDLVVILDAPADILFARKGEGTPERLERRRQEYLCLRHEARLGSMVIDATQPPERVLADAVAWVTEAIREHARGYDPPGSGRV